ncbi:MAG: polysaccharide biosynthesis tyrosine autokinase [Deltaproteobacteria bacterium]|nr:polysaccharide biosynthesis tyrosine autokinase [Candidatus Tharpellaceae bacterium]
MSRIQDALKKAEQESQATSVTVRANTVVEEPRPAAPMAKPEPQSQPVTPVVESGAVREPEIAAEPLERERIEPQSDKPTVTKPTETKPTPVPVASGRKTSQKIDLNPALLDEHLVSLTKPFSLASEQVKKLRTKIILSAPERLPNKTILITSAVPREGKTTIAVNLALSLAQGLDEYVLLVDCDFRKPEISKYLGMEFNLGLSNYLTSDIDLSSVLVKTDLSRLTILPMGLAPAKPSELLASERMTHLIEDLQSRYQDRYIIFDTTSLMSTSEADILASQVDGIVIVVRYGETDRDVVKQALKNIDRDKIIGVVFNGADYRTSSFYYQETR